MLFRLLLFLRTSPSLRLLWPRVKKKKKRREDLVAFLESIAGKSFQDDDGYDSKRSSYSDGDLPPAFSEEVVVPGKFLFFCQHGGGKSLEFVCVCCVLCCAYVKKKSDQIKNHNLKKKKKTPPAAFGIIHPK